MCVYDFFNDNMNVKAFCCHTGPDSVMVRAFASEAGGAGSNRYPGRVIPKTLKMVPMATLLGAKH